MKNTKWPSMPESFDLINLPHFTRGASGVFPVIGTVFNEVGREVLLVMQDSTDFVYDIVKIKPFRLFLKPGAVQTSFGPVVFILWYVLDPSGENVFCTFESTLNIHDPKIVSPYEKLSKQSDWHLLIMGMEQEVLEYYEFENNFGLDESIKLLKESCINMPCIDFNMAKQEFEQTYTIKDLMNMR